jgi:predicted oxidoreductase
VLGKEGEPIPGSMPRAKSQGGGGGGYHGYNALEGTFLGSCIFSGPQRRAACGRAKTGHPNKHIGITT